MSEHSTIFVISDRTGITVEKLVHTLLTQFDRMPAERIVRPFLDKPAKIASVVAEIDAAAEADDMPPLVYSSVVDRELREQLKQCQGQVFDIFDEFLPSMSKGLHLQSANHVGRAHGIRDRQDYDTRVEAVNFALTFDDGARVRGLDKADLILIGVSRSGKTPTCLYLAMQYSVLAANYPLTEEDFLQGRIPQPLLECRDRLFGLSITPERLHQIRSERRPGSGYASMASCRREVTAAENLYRSKQIPFVDSTAMSIEELAIAVMQRAGVQREV